MTTPSARFQIRKTGGSTRIVRQRIRVQSGLFYGNVSLPEILGCLVHFDRQALVLKIFEIDGSAGSFKGDLQSGTGMVTSEETLTMFSKPTLGQR